MTAWQPATSQRAERGEVSSDDDHEGQDDPKRRGRRPRRERRTGRAGRRCVGGGHDEHGGGGNGGGGLAGSGRDDDHVAAPQPTQPAQGRHSHRRWSVHPAWRGRDWARQARMGMHRAGKRGSARWHLPWHAASPPWSCSWSHNASALSWGPCLHGHAAALTVRAMPREWSAGNAGRVRRRASGTGDSSAPGPGAVGPADFRPLPECWLR